jgi:hypothetical protein
LLDAEFVAREAAVLIGEQLVGGEVNFSINPSGMSAPRAIVRVNDRL